MYICTLNISIGLLMLLVTMYPGQKVVVEGETVSVSTLDSLNHGGEIKITNKEGLVTHLKLYVADVGYPLACGATLYFVGVFNSKGQGRIGIDADRHVDIVFP